MLSPSFGKVVYIKIISLKLKQNKVKKQRILIRTIQQKRHPFWDAFLFGGDGGISARFARRIASAKPKILRLRLEFLGRQVLTRWVLIHTKIEKELPKGNSFSMAEMVGFEPTCPVKDKTISSRSRYDHFDTSPCSVQQTVQRYRRGRLRMA